MRKKHQHIFTQLQVITERSRVIPRTSYNQSQSSLEQMPRTIHYRHQLQSPLRQIPRTSHQQLEFSRTRPETGLKRQSQEIFDLWFFS
jgi:hypothetical protein